MERLRSIQEFQNLRQRLTVGRDPSKPTIVISAGTCGQASGANDLIRICKRELMERGLTDRIRLRITGCHGFCEAEPSVLIEPEGVFYPKVGTKEMVEIVTALAEGRTLRQLLMTDPATGQPIELQKDVPFFRRQVRTILSRNEKVDPIRIYTYIASGGYAALMKVLAQNDPAQVVQEVKTTDQPGAK